MGHFAPLGLLDALFSVATRTRYFFASDFSQMNGVFVLKHKTEVIGCISGRPPHTLRNFRDQKLGLLRFLYGTQNKAPNNAIMKRKPTSAERPLRASGTSERALVCCMNVVQTFYYWTGSGSPGRGPIAQMGWVTVTAYLWHQSVLPSLAEGVSVRWPWAPGCDHSLLLQDINWRPCCSLGRRPVFTKSSQQHVKCKSSVSAPE